MKKSIGQQIRRIRVGKDLTQENIAFELGITKGAYSKIERDSTSISIKRLEEIAKVLEVEIGIFFSENPIMEDSEKQQYGFATKSDMEQVVKMIQELAAKVDVLQSKQSIPEKEDISKGKKKS